MKSRRTLRSLFYFGCLFSLFLCFSCGNTEDEQEATNPTNNTFLDAPDELWFQLEDEGWKQLKDAKQWLQLVDAQKWLQLTDEDWEKLTDEDWEKLKDKDWIRLTDKEVKELMNFQIPPLDGEQVAWEEALKHSHASLFQEFGDIPQVRYKVEFERQHWNQKSGVVIVTLELSKQEFAHSVATYFLFPDADNQRTLEENRKQLKFRVDQKEPRLLEQLRIENPEAWVKVMRAFLIRKHGDIRGVDAIANFLRKLELNLPRTDKECHTYIEAYRILYDSNRASAYEYYATFEAAHQIAPLPEGPLRDELEKYRKARAEGISFYDIEGSND